MRYICRILRQNWNSWNILFNVESFSKILMINFNNQIDIFFNIAWFEARDSVTRIFKTTSSIVDFHNAIVDKSFQFITTKAWWLLKERLNEHQYRTEDLVYQTWCSCLKLCNYKNSIHEHIAQRLKWQKERSVNECIDEIE